MLQPRIGIGIALAFCLLPLAVTPAGEKKDAAKNSYFKGSVVALARLLEKQGLKLDDDAVPHWLVLKADDGKIYPLVKDDGSRMFFKDAQLLNRPMRLTGKLMPGSQLLQVVEVHSYDRDNLLQVFYWCDICTIKRFEKKICDCCGGPMELREVPVK